TVRPVDLCIYEEAFHDLILNWSGVKFLNDIKYWLESTALGDLHHEDQPLEPFFSPSGIVIYSDKQPSADLIVQLGKNTYKLYTFDSVRADNKIIGAKRYLVCPLEPKEIQHGIVNTSQNNLVQLSIAMQKIGIDLSSEIRVIIDRVMNNPQSDVNIEMPICFLLRMDVKRDEDLEAESVQQYFFKINETLLNIGLKTEYLSKSPHDNSYVKTDVLQSSLNLERCSSVNVEVLNPHYDFTYANSKSLNDISLKNEKIYSLIGVGALGSQFLNNMVRQGIGKWNVFDHDILLPHNLTRHFSNRYGIGKNKAQYVSHYINNIIYENETIVSAYEENVLVSHEKVKRPLSKSDYIIDVSTSIAVERSLAAKYLKNRKFTAFLNPNGDELVLMSEDNKSSIALDLIEFQYYKELMSSDKLLNHYKFEEEGLIRYARGCRDITSRINQSNLSIFSGLLSKAIQKNISSPEGSIEIWQLYDDFSVNKLDFSLDNWVQIEIEGWSININRKLIHLMSDFRKSKLPNETGGILLGGVDTQHKKIYLVDSILSPRDSVEKRTIYIRGLENVKEEIAKISKLTNDSIGYLGEWHSHPNNCSLDMSSDDIHLFKELIDEARLRGVPTLMLIQGENSFNLYIGNNEF
ncbi:MAG: ThiF family adenylyltransferase, partial [Oleispira sp.]|nr:ThiF family adenylyltransferase [Oleispira sp.]